MVKRFQKRKEDFTCEHCGASVTGTGYTDHCPECLYGKHVDIFPGDRLEECQGILEPQAIVDRKGKQAILYRCGNCKEESVMGVAKTDNPEAIIRLMQKRADALFK